MPKDRAYLEAEQKIQQALRSGATELDLRNMKLTELPESIGQLKRLRKFDVGDDSLERMKKESTDRPARLAGTTHAVDIPGSLQQPTDRPARTRWDNSRS